MADNQQQQQMNITEGKTVGEILLLIGGTAVISIGALKALDVLFPGMVSQFTGRPPL